MPIPAPSSPPPPRAAPICCVICWMQGAATAWPCGSASHSRHGRFGVEQAGQLLAGLQQHRHRGADVGGGGADQQLELPASATQR
jgi:hypothetical protein